MIKKYIITEEKFEAIKKAIKNQLNLWHYDFIYASDRHGHEISMSKDTFFEGLKREFIIQ